MSIYVIPNSDKKIVQLNKNDAIGNIWYTRNIDLNSPGKVLLARRTSVVAQQSTSGSDFDHVRSIVYGNFNSASTSYKYWLITSDKIATVNSDLSGFAVDAISGSPSLHFGSDGCQWNGDLYVSKTSRIDKLSAGTWTNSWSGSAFSNTSSGFPHPIEPNVTNANLLVGDGKFLKTVASDGTVATAFTLPSSYRITWIRRGNGLNYIGCQNVVNGYGAVVTWDGLPTTISWNNIYPIPSTRVYSGILDEEGIFNVITDDGRLMAFNGSGFTTVAEFPVFRQAPSNGWYQSQENFPPVLQRGTALVNGKIHINLYSYIDNVGVIPQFTSGVWVYDKDVGLYHKYGPSAYSTISDYGSSYYSSGPGAISPIFRDPSGSVVDISDGSEFIIGGRLSTIDSSTDFYNLISVTSGANRGSFVTTMLESEKISDKPTSVWCKYDNVLTSLDKILFKYRITKPSTYPILGITATWSSTTQFTTTDSGFSNAVVGDEVTIQNRVGSGSTAHISTISLNTGTYTVTLDEAMTGVASTNTGLIMVDNWKKLPTVITNADTMGYKRIPIPSIKDSSWIQIKTELRGDSRVEIGELKVLTVDQQPVI